MWRKLEKNNDKGIDSKERAIGIKKMTKMKGLGTKNISQSRHLVEEKYEKEWKEIREHGNNLGKNVKTWKLYEPKNMFFSLYNT